MRIKVHREIQQAILRSGAADRIAFSDLIASNCTQIEARERRCDGFFQVQILNLLLVHGTRRMK